MTCPHCDNELDYSFSCNLNNVRTCIQCAYDSLPVDAPARKSFERNYELDVEDE